MKRPLWRLVHIFLLLQYSLQLNLAFNPTQIVGQSDLQTPWRKKKNAKYFYAVGPILFWRNGDISAKFLESIWSKDCLEGR